MRSPVSRHNYPAVAAAEAGLHMQEKVSQCPDKEAQSTEIASENIIYPTGWRLAAILISLIFGTLLVALDNTIIGVAVPRITTDFQALDDVGWYASAYLITVTALQPTYGNVYKYFPVKRTYLIAILIFEAGSVLCAAAPKSFAFIIGRAVAGVGAAGVLQGSLGIISLIAPLNKRPLYFSIVLSIFGVAVCAGPILGGVITEHMTWRWCFWINVPIGGLACVIILIFLQLHGAGKENRRLALSIKLQHLDFGGAITLIAGVACLLIALQWGGHIMPWHSAKVIGLFVGFGLLLTVFAWIQWRRGERATIPLRIIRQRSILLGCIYIAFLDMAAYAYAYYLPFYFQGVQGVSAITSGIRFLPLVAPQIVATVVSGALVSRFGYYVPFMILGSTFAAVGTGLLSQFRPDTPTSQWSGFLVIIGLGLGFGMQQPYTAVQVSLKEEDTPTGNAIVVFLQQLGGAISVPIGETLFLNGIYSEVPLYTPSITPSSVIQAGATKLHSITSDPTALRALRMALAKAVARTMYLAVGTTGVSLVFALGMEWRNVVKEKESRFQKDGRVEERQEKSAIAGPPRFDEGGIRG